MQFDCLGGRHSAQSSYLDQVWTKLPAIARRDFQLSPIWETHGFQPVEVTPQNFLQFAVAQLQHIEVDKKRAIRGVKIADARDRFRLQQAEQSPDSLMSIECDLLAKVNQKRLIACGLESRAAGHRCGHLGKYIAREIQHGRARNRSAQELVADATVNSIDCFWRFLRPRVAA